MRAGFAVSFPPPEKKTQPRGSKPGLRETEPGDVAPVVRHDVTRDRHPVTERWAILPEQAFVTLQGDSTAFRVYAALALHANRSGYAYPSQAVLGDLLGLGRVAVGRAIDRLMTAGFVEKSARTIGGRKVGNGYTLTVHGCIARDTPGSISSDTSSRGRDPLLEKEHLEMNKEKPSQPEPHLATVTEMPSDRIIDVPSIVDEVFAEWVRANGKTARTSLSPERRKLIERRFSKDGYPVEDILDAIRGNAASDWHAENGHTDLKDAIGDIAKLEKWRDVWRRPKRARMANQSAGSYDKFAEIDRRAAERTARGAG